MQESVKYIQKRRHLQTIAYMILLALLLSLTLEQVFQPWKHTEAPRLDLR